MSNRNRSLSAVLFLLLLCLGAAPAALAAPNAPAHSFRPPEVAPSPGAIQALEAHFVDYRIVELPLGALERAVRTEGRLDLVLRGRRYALDVEPIELRDPAYRAVLMTPHGPVEVPRVPGGTYAGHLADDPSATVRLTADRGLFLGYVRSGDEWLFVDPLRDYHSGAPPRLAVVYTQADVRPEAAGECGVGALHAMAGKSGATPGPIAKGHTTLRRVDIATDADAEYFQSHGNPGTFTRILAAINGMDGIYRNDVNLYFNVTYQQAWTVPSTDPYTSTSMATTLNQVTNWWNANRTGVNRDLTHLFSDRAFSSFTVGLADVATVCNMPSEAYAVSKDQASNFLRIQLLSHEVGHNFSAVHIGQTACSSISCSGTGPIMCFKLQGSGPNTFASCSISAIDNHTHNNGSCLN